MLNNKNKEDEFLIHPLLFFNMKIIFSCVLILLIVTSSAFAKTERMAVEQNTMRLITLEIVNGDTLIKISATDSLPVLSKTESLTNEQRKRKLLASCLSFPFPLGFLGTHRIMMGTKPWVPIAYVATFGGCFGLLPLVDFCVIMFSDNVEKYENNPNVFMWIK